ncbi:nucleotidyltransferase domain-containing protein [Mycoplasma sp. VS42A]|uniref:nucleotidyltransferase domain-containing protein n=1 Tax=unclassified Mycoplasma TaxID=2683645 RepID=UPI003A85DECE
MADIYLANEWIIKNKNIVVHGSYALKMQNLLSRDCNDIDLLIISDGGFVENNQIVHFIADIYNLDIIYSNEFITKVYCNKTPIEFMKFKEISHDMIEKKNEVNVLKPIWIFMFKICQLFTNKIIDIRKQNRKTKIITTIKDLNYILNNLLIIDEDLTQKMIKAILINLRLEMFTYSMSPYIEILNYEIFFMDYTFYMSENLVRILEKLKNDDQFIKFIRRLKLFYQVFRLYIEKNYAKLKNRNNNFGYIFFYENNREFIDDILFLNRYLNCDFSSSIKYIMGNNCIDFSEIINTYFKKYLIK